MHTDNGADLKTAVRRTLDARGVTAELKAKLRAEIFHALADKSERPPALPAEVFLARELVREFLQCFGYKNTLSVLMEESGHQGEARVDREFLAEELRIDLSSRETEAPLLLGIVQYLRHAKHLEESMDNHDQSESGVAGEGLLIHRQFSPT